MASARSASLWAVAGSTATRGLSFVFFLLIARQLSPAHLGVMALALAFGLLLDAVAELGLSDQVVRHHDESDKAFMNGVFWLQAAVATAGALALCAVAPWVAGWYHEPALQWALTGVALASWMTALSQLPTALLVRRMEHRVIARRQTIATLVGGVLGLGLAHLGHGVTALVAMHVANAATGLLIVWTASAWRPHSPAWGTQAAALHPVAPLARQTLLTKVLETAMSRVDQVLIGAFFGTTALGLYALAVRLYDVLFQALCMPISSVMLPYLSRARDEPAEFRERFATVLKTTSLVAPPLFLLGAVFLPTLLPVLFGARWVPASPYIQIILGVGAVHAMSFTHTPAFAAMGRPVANLWVTGVSSALWLMSLLFLPALGAVFAAVLWAGRSVVGLGIQLVLMHRWAGLPWRQYWLSTRAMLAGSAAVLLLTAIDGAGQRWPLPGLGGTVLSMILSAGILGVAAWLASEPIRQSVLQATRTLIERFPVRAP